jgi:hypothetical protein
LLEGVQEVVAVEVLEPVGLIDRVEERSPRSGASATAVRLLPSCWASQLIAPLTTVPVEPPKRNPRRASV